MFDELKIRLDTLNELLELGYLTKAEHAAAKENLLFDEGFDITPRDHSERILQPIYRQKKHSGCGCFMILVLIIVASLGIVLALPKDMIQNVPVLNKFFTEEGLEELRQKLFYFIDDLRGNPVYPIQGQDSTRETTMEQSLIVPKIQNDPAPLLAIPEPDEETRQIEEQELVSLDILIPELDSDSSNSGKSWGWWFP